MDCEKIGRLICGLRKEKGLTQRELAERLRVSDKAVSKWERGLGCPDVSLLTALSAVLGVDVQGLLAGELEQNDTVGGNMKQLKFYVCPQCGNLLTSTAEAAVSCCGKPLEALTARKAEPEERLSVELIENEYFVSSPHEMTKEHYVAFVALLTGDAVILRKMYPEWDLQTRIPRLAHGLLVWYCTRHGLCWQPV